MPDDLNSMSLEDLKHLLYRKVAAQTAAKGPPQMKVEPPGELKNPPGFLSQFGTRLASNIVNTPKDITEMVAHPSSAFISGEPRKDEGSLAYELTGGKGLPKETPGQFDPFKTTPQGAADLATVLGPGLIGGEYGKVPDRIAPFTNTARAVGTGIKSAAPQVALGAGESALGIGMLKGLPHPFGYAGYAPMFEGMRQIKSGLSEGLKAGKESFHRIGPVDPIKAAPEVPIEQGATSKVPTFSRASNSIFEKAVINGDKTMEEYANFLAEKRTIPEDIELITNNLQNKIDAIEEAKIAKTSKEKSPVDTSKLKVNDPGERISKINEKSESLKQELNRIAPGNEIGEVKSSNLENQLSESLRQIREKGKIDRPFIEEGSKLNEQQIERAQSENRTAKENKLGQYLANNKSIENLDDLKPTEEMLKALGKEAGLKYKPSLRTFEGAVKKAKLFRSGTP